MGVRRQTNKGHITMPMRFLLGSIKRPWMAIVVVTVATATGVSISGWDDPIAAGLNQPSGLDYDPSSDALIVAVSADAARGESGFESVSLDGERSRFGRAATWSSGSPVAIVKGEDSKFAQGSVYSARGDGELVHVTETSAPGANSWVKLPGERGRVSALYFDRTGAFDGDLLAGTSTGHLWQIDPSARATLLATTGSAISALVTIPKSDRYGQWAGMLLAATDSPQCRLFAVDTSGQVTEHDIGVCATDLDLVIPDADLFIAAVITTESKPPVGALLKKDASELASYGCNVIASDAAGRLVVFGQGGPSGSSNRIELSAASPRGLAFSASGNSCQPDVCGDGIDNNEDGAVDEDCQEVCGDGIDNDSNGDVDDTCAEVCGDGEDNDNNGVVDEGCQEICGDHVDNDGDDQVDMPCPEVCRDGIDNDQNGQTDENCPPLPVAAGCSADIWLTYVERWTAVDPRQLAGTVFSLNDTLAPLGLEPLGTTIRPSRVDEHLAPARALLQASIAALLNAQTAGVGYPLPASRVLLNVNKALESHKSARIEALASVLEAINKLKCPLPRLAPPAAAPKPPP
jgi:hypothetical protein